MPGSLWGRWPVREGVVLHGAGDTPDGFRPKFRHVESRTGGVVAWAFPHARKQATPEDCLTYAGLAAARFKHSCWDAEQFSGLRGGIALGFSMGAITAMQLGHSLPPGSLSAVVCVAGCYSLMQAFGTAYAPHGTGSFDTLFIHGDSDVQIPESLARECSDGLRRAGHKVDFWSVPGAGHSWGELGLDRASPLSKRLIGWIENPDSRGRCL
ncbi:alpha/beta hydrolase [Janibacter anophelis]|uniref:alpha/beta hydrolase n=1 Tax=Janibacter anophelis TaxID=319054 RepID=UPI003F80A21E